MDTCVVLCEGPLDAIAIDLLAAEHKLPMVGVAAEWHRIH